MASNKTKGNSRTPKSRTCNSKDANSSKNYKREDSPLRSDGKDYKRTEIRGKVYNDPAWRTYNALLGAQVASYPFTEFVGGKFNLSLASDDMLTRTPPKRYPIQIMSVLLNPSVGFSDGAGTYDAINQAALKMYTQFSSSNMKTTQYGPQDITACILALGEIISLSEYIRRAIGFAATVNPRNWFYPKQIIAAMGLDWNDLQKNIGVYRERFNYVSALASAIAFPKNLDYFKSCASLYSNVFLDHTTGMAQSIVTIPYSTWKLDEASNPTGTVLKTLVMPYTGSDRNNVPTAITPVKLESIMVIYEELLDRMFNSSTLQYLYADVLKFVSNSTDSLVSIPMIDSSYGAVPTYSEEFLINLENAVVLNAPLVSAIEDPDGIVGTLATPSNDVVLMAGTNAVQYMPAFNQKVSGSAKYSRHYCDAIVNFHKDDPDDMTRIMATRFTPAVRRVHNYQIQGSTDKACMVQYNLPDHYIVGIKTFRHRVITSGATEVWQQDFIVDELYRTRDLEVFSHPIITVSGTISLFPEAGRIAVSDLQCDGEMDVYTVVPNETISKIVDLAILSLFTFK